jgi:hypothetical protein
MHLVKRFSLLVVVLALLGAATPASAHRLSLSKAERLAIKLDAKYRQEARSPVVFSDIFGARRFNAHRIDFEYFVEHENGRTCEATIVTRFRNSVSTAGKAKFVHARCT